MNMQSTPIGIQPTVLYEALIQDLETGTFAVEFAFNSVLGRTGRIQVPRALTKRPSEIVAQLLDAGAILPDDPKEAVEVVRTALLQPAIQNYAVTRRGGWHEDSYVTRSATVGSRCEKLRFAVMAPVDPGFGMQAGSMQAWKAGLQEPCQASTYLTFAMSLGYGGAVLDALEEDEGAMFNLHGFSSSGKTLAARALNSVSGRARQSDLATYDMTDRAVEELCYARTDWAVVFDEEGRTRGSEVQRRERVRQLAFIVPGGRGKTRSNAVRSELPNQAWRLFALSSGEKPLEDKEHRRVAGEQVRHIDLMIPHTDKGGIFDRLKGRSDERRQQAGSLAKQIQATVEENFGVAQQAFLAALVADRSAAMARVKLYITKFIKDVGATNDAWERRFAHKFAVVAAGAMLAAEFGTAPFTSEHALLCAKKAYRVARRCVFTAQEAEKSFMDRLRACLNDKTILPVIEKGESLPPKLKPTAIGFRRHLAKQGEIVAIDPTKFESMVGSKPAADAVLSLLIGKKIAVKGAGNKTRPQIAVQGFDREGRSRWVCLKASAF